MNMRINTVTNFFVPVYWDKTGEHILINSHFGPKKNLDINKIRTWEPPLNYNLNLPHLGAYLEKFSLPLQRGIN